MATLIPRPTRSLWVDLRSFGSVKSNFDKRHNVLPLAHRFGADSAYSALPILAPSVGIALASGCRSSCNRFEMGSKVVSETKCG
jgi:hypothetical protein